MVVCGSIKDVHVSLCMRMPSSPAYSLHHVTTHADHLFRVCTQAHMSTVHVKGCTLAIVMETMHDVAVLLCAARIEVGMCPCFDRIWLLMSQESAVNMTCMWMSFTLKHTLWYMLPSSLSLRMDNSDIYPHGDEVQPALAANDNSTTPPCWCRPLTACMFCKPCTWLACITNSNTMGRMKD